ncbi:MAG: hypothetical protein ABW185_16705 [Sedimenticola sp.]
MTNGIRKTIHYLLAIMLAVLPFTSVYSDSCHPKADMEMAMHGQAGMMDCQHADSLEHAGPTANDDSCCSDQCDVSFGVQLNMRGEWRCTFSSSSIFTTYTPPAIPDPFIFSFLRPPLTIS